MTEENTVRRLERERRAAPAELFTGRVELEMIHANPEIPLAQNRVHFYDGGHTHWHLHTGDQVLYFVAGLGMAQSHGGPVIECQPGDIVHVPPSTRHQHGAMPGHDAAHVAITQGEAIWDHDPRYPK